ERLGPIGHLLLNEVVPLALTLMEGEDLRSRLGFGVAQVAHRAVELGGVAQVGAYHPAKLADMPDRRAERHETEKTSPWRTNDERYRGENRPHRKADEHRPGVRVLEPTQMVLAILVAGCDTRMLGEPSGWQTPDGGADCPSDLAREAHQPRLRP